MFKISTLLALTAVSFTLAGCAHVNHHVDDATVPISMTSNIGREYTMISNFDDSQKKVFFLWNLIPASTFNGGEMAKQHLQQSDGIVNLKITTSYDIVDWLVALVTAGLVDTMDIDVHGQLIKFKEPQVIVNSATPPQSNINVQ